MTFLDVITRGSTDCGVCGESNEQSIKLIDSREELPFSLHGDDHHDGRPRDSLACFFFFLLLFLNKSLLK